MDQGAPPNPRDFPLQNMDGIIPNNLRTWLRHTIKERNLPKYNFALKMINHNYGILNERLLLDICGFTHFQVYDWLMLSEADQGEVLAGTPPRNGYFQKPNRPPLQDQRLAQLPLSNADGTLNVENLRIRLDYTLSINTWSRSQFAFHLFNRTLGTGYIIAAIIDDPDYRPDPMIFELIRRWLEMRDCDRRRVISGNLEAARDIRHLNEIVNSRPWSMREEIPRAHLEYLAHPDTFNISDADYQRWLQTAVEKQINLLIRERRRLDGIFGLASDEYREAVRITLHDYYNVREYLYLRTDNLTRIDLLKCLGFMYGMQIDRYKTADCIKFVLAANGQNQGDFAEIVLETTLEYFNDLITNPQCHGVRAESKIFFLQIGMYLIKSCEERKQAWIDGCRKDHLEFLENPYTFNLDKPGFKRRMLIVVEPQWEILRHWLGDGPLQVLKENTEHLVNFLANQADLQFDDYIIRRRIINLAYIDGATYNWTKMTECIGRVLRPEHKGQFARNVLNCTLETFEFLLASPMQHLFNGQANALHFLKIDEYLLKNCEDRWRALNGV